MLMTGTAMKCGANRTLKEWVRQVQFEFVHNVRVRSKELNSTARSIAVVDANDAGEDACNKPECKRMDDMHF